MIYPKFLNDKDLVGICAPSAGIGRKLDKYLLSLNNLSKYFTYIETRSVRSNNDESNTPLNRAKEFNELLNNKDIKMIHFATGGDFLISSLEYIDFDLIKQNTKWIQGYSDPTSILFYITTKYDIATIYGTNLSGFDQTTLYDSLLNNIDILKGNIIEQHNFKLFESNKSNNIEYNLDTLVKYEFINGFVFEKGRLIGGCLDVISNLIGTPYDCTKKFIERYKQDGIIWYFDIFSISSEELYNKLYQMKYAGYFKYTKCILIGRICFPKQFSSKNYKTILKEVLPDIKIIYNFDIGHVPPRMTLINGSIVEIKSDNESTTLKTYLN